MFPLIQTLTIITFSKHKHSSCSLKDKLEVLKHLGNDQKRIRPQKDKTD